ncbi:uncharacterized protein F5147DRAFT_767882 [Suillus discolor]|uniref:Uncharacterized protein n=1 Tax=Suillus discolor TaxID=1912936 RepID=A0A9P7K067_9AGAM|nr:uncharacterized protein F5147DRAFT_767882 [Suillus discolor]KAG2119151.1 hypothetical protein F5147DRAFT_767882 [Suillus discolor]
MRTTALVANANTIAPPDIWFADTTDTVAGGWGATGDTGKPHNPHENDIVVVLEPTIVREENEAPKKSNGTHGKKAKGPLDELSGIFPSYFVSREHAK